MMSNRVHHSQLEIQQGNVRHRAESGRRSLFISIFGPFQSFWFCIINSPVKLYLVYILTDVTTIKKQYWAITMALDSWKPIKNWGILKETEWQCHIVPLSKPHGASMPILLTPKWLDLEPNIIYFVIQKKNWRLPDLHYAGKKIP